jgi:predicted transcriptional regulator
LRCVRAERIPESLDLETRAGATRCTQGGLEPSGNGILEASMQVTVEIPDDALASIGRLDLTPSEYAGEVIRAHLETLILGDTASIDKRPDWQTAIARGRDEIRRGLGISHAEVRDWHKSHGE